MWYIVCLLAGTTIGLLGGLLVVRKRLSGDGSGGSGALSPDQLKRIQLILKLIQEGDEILDKLDELIEEGKSK
jgi:uncharacterized membrane protein